MSQETGAEKRKGRRIVLERRIVSSENPVVTSQLQTEITEASKLFVSVKEAEIVKPRTKSEYHILFGYFKEWLSENHSEIIFIQDMTAIIVRSYINYLAFEKVGYEGIPYRVEKLQSTTRLSPFTVNIWIRFLKCWFNVLVTENILLSSPMQNIKLVRVVEDTKEPMIEEGQN
ncbi:MULTISPECIES: hypothetical protein [unclassified Paenibacillus]|uniref:hypothetical protein n=1 Tax=unclassified Paenibacillus TaxID=185978 RepID=UPI00363CE2FF